MSSKSGSFGFSDSEKAVGIVIRHEDVLSKSMHTRAPESAKNGDPDEMAPFIYVTGDV